MTKFNKITLIISCILLVAVGIFTTASMYVSPHTYEGEGHDVTDIFEDPDEAAKDEEFSGVAEGIIDETLDKTKAVNAVSAVVFDFRGFDTMGESFILITAISGSLVILRKIKKGGHKENAENEKQH